MYNVIHIYIHIIYDATYYVLPLSWLRWSTMGHAGVPFSATWLMASNVASLLHQDRIIVPLVSLFWNLKDLKVGCGKILLGKL